MKKTKIILLSIVGLAAIFVILLIIFYNPPQQNQSGPTQTPTTAGTQNSGQQQNVSSAATDQNQPGMPTTGTDCGTVDESELQPGALTQNAQQFLACLNSALNDCLNVSATINVNSQNQSFAIGPLNNDCSVKFTTPQYQWNGFNLTCLFSSEAKQSFFSAVGDQMSSSLSSADKNSFKGLTLVETILGQAGIQITNSSAPTSTSANPFNFNFTLPYTSSTVNCLGTK